MTIAVPTLSVAGWVTDASSKADALFSHFYCSDKAQTFLYGNNVSNLQWLIEEYGGDLVAVTTNLRVTLLTYLSRYYESVNVEVTNDDNPLIPKSSIGLTVYCKVVDNGIEYSFGKLLQITNSKIANVINLNTNGLPQ